MAELNFKGKAFVQNHHFTVPVHEFVADAKKSKLKKGEKPRLDDNLIIHGDNLKALKALLPIYAGRIKCIYIDPPYNTGKEHWVYNDNVNSPMMRAWLGKEVGMDDLSRHDKWLCMMMPRLKLLQELLREDGVIFVSINDVEVSNLKLLMDEIFSDGFITCLVRQTIKGGTGPSDSIRVTHDYILAYAKDKDQVDISGLTAEAIELDQEDEKGKYARGRELNKWGAGSRREDSPSMWFPIPGPGGKKVFPIRNDGSEGRWRWGKRRMLGAVAAGDVIFEKRKDGTYIVYEKVRDNGGRTKSYQSLLLDRYTSAIGTEELKTIFDGKSLFDYPKPTSLMDVLFRISNVSDSDIVLDSFAGSGSTAHAALSYSRSEDMNAKFILVQIPEVIRNDKPAYKYGFRKVIELTAERVKRVIDGVSATKDEELKKGLGGSFSYFELGDAIDKETLLKGKKLPSYEAMAAYVFHTATNAGFDAKKMIQKKGFIGSTDDLEVYLIYKPDAEFLKEAALDADFLKSLGKPGKKVRLVFAPVKYIDNDALENHKVEFAQLPQEIYRR
ncbi:MAG: hypothetical protein A2Z88_11745 [Omnitrophica WOR_2 bacterium GWA2_47_8]|nr:MAG: hypothetical protein A2Z88_11745 [Omnitrophica WOR_2 bacterium GWA2_47_8]